MAARLALSLPIFVGVLSCALADQPTPPSMPPARPVPMQAYGSDNPACLEWTDGCTVCTKSETGEIACSTPGIACQPAGLQCKKTAH
jgi:hypothetical protein